MFVGSEALVEPCILVSEAVLWKSSCVETINGTTFPLTCHGTVKDHIGVLWNAARKSPCLTRCQVLLDTLAAQRHIAVSVRSVRDVWWIIFLYTTAQQLGDSNTIPTVGPPPTRASEFQSVHRAYGVSPPCVGLDGIALPAKNYFLT